MPVFISHRSSDNTVAMEIHRHLSVFGIKCYVDELDKVLQTTNDIASIIQQRLGECTHLLAVVSTHTQASWCELAPKKWTPC